MLIQRRRTTIRRENALGLGLLSCCFLFFLSSHLILLPSWLLNGFPAFLATLLFALYLELNANVFLDFKYNLYGYFHKGVDWVGMLYIGIYVPVNIVYLNFFPYRKAFVRKLVYILGWTIFSGIYELLFLWTKTFYYQGWMIWFSLIIYPFLFVFLNVFHLYVLYLLRKYQRQSR